MAGFGFGEFFQDVATSEVTFVMCKVTVGAHALHFALPVLLEGGDELLGCFTSGCYTNGLSRLCVGGLFFFSLGAHSRPYSSFAVRAASCCNTCSNFPSREVKRCSIRSLMIPRSSFIALISSS